MTDFAILGPLEVRRDGEDVALGGPRQRAVLALLLLHANQVVSIERIADALYRGDAPATAVTQVHRQVSELRRLLDPELIETRAPGYRVRVGPDDLDLRRFERLVEGAVGAARDEDHERAASGLRAALGLWRGPALADLADAAFAEGSVARLEELRLTALEARIEADLALGRHAELIAELRGLAAEHPLRERLRELLMLGLYRSGRQVEALEEYRRAREELVRAFGLEPGPGLRRLEQAILRQDPALSPPDAERPAQRTGRVVLVVRDAGRLGLLHALAAPLARRPPRELVVALLASDEARLPAAVAAVEELRGDARTAAFVATRESEDIRHLADTQEADLLVL
ncbi:MAG: hypothetical protein QOG77_1005, partial [Solirubrobacteraceae bacterium]|nr:hypothetical protein [Solirubrobacteraceae bacterium]